MNKKSLILSLTILVVLSIFTSETFSSLYYANLKVSKGIIAFTSVNTTRPAGIPEPTPQQAFTTDVKPVNFTQEPDYVAGPRYGNFTLRGITFWFALDTSQPGGQFDRIYIDRNANKNLTDDGGPYKLYDNVTLNVSGVWYNFNITAIAPDGSYANITSQSWFIGNFTLQGNSYGFVLYDNNTDGIFDTLCIDDDAEGTANFTNDPCFNSTGLAYTVNITGNLYNFTVYNISDNPKATASTVDAALKSATWFVGQAKINDTIYYFAVSDNNTDGYFTAIFVNNATNFTTPLNITSNGTSITLEVDLTGPVTIDNFTWPTTLVFDPNVKNVSVNVNYTQPPGLENATEANFTNTTYEVISNWASYGLTAPDVFMDIAENDLTSCPPGAWVFNGTLNISYGPSENITYCANASLGIIAIALDGKTWKNVTVPGTVIINGTEGRPYNFTILAISDTINGSAPGVNITLNTTYLGNITLQGNNFAWALYDSDSNGAFDTLCINSTGTGLYFDNCAKVDETLAVNLTSGLIYNFTVIYLAEDPHTSNTTVSIRSNTWFTPSAALPIAGVPHYFVVADNDTDGNFTVIYYSTTFDFTNVPPIANGTEIWLNDTISKAAMVKGLLYVDNVSYPQHVFFDPSPINATLSVNYTEPTGIGIHEYPQEQNSSEVVTKPLGVANNVPQQSPQTTDVKPASITSEPDYVAGPRYGNFTLEGKTFYFALDWAVPGGPFARIIIDTDADLNLTDEIFLQASNITEIGTITPRLIYNITYIANNGSSANITSQSFLRATAILSAINIPTVLWDNNTDGVLEHVAFDLDRNATFESNEQFVANNVFTFGIKYLIKSIDNALRKVFIEPYGASKSLTSTWYVGKVILKTSTPNVILSDAEKANEFTIIDLDLDADGRFDGTSDLRGLKKFDIFADITGKRYEIDDIRYVDPQTYTVVFEEYYPPEIPPAVDLKVSGPSMITVFVGEKKTVVVNVSNVGSDYLYHVKVVIDKLPEDLNYSTQPEEYALIKPGEAKQFNLTIDATKAKPKVVNVTLKAVSGNIEAWQKLTLNVTVKVVKECEDKLSEIASIENEVMELEGKVNALSAVIDVSDLKQEIESIYNILNQAREFAKKEKCKEAENKIEEASEKLENVEVKYEEKLSLAKSELDKAISDLENRLTTLALEAEKYNAIEAIQKIEDARRVLSEAKQSLESNDLISTKNVLNRAETLISDAENIINRAKEEVAKKEKEVKREVEGVEEKEVNITIAGEKEGEGISVKIVIAAVAAIVAIIVAVVFLKKP